MTFSFCFRSFSVSTIWHSRTLILSGFEEKKKRGMAIAMAHTDNSSDHSPPSPATHFKSHPPGVLFLLCPFIVHGPLHYLPISFDRPSMIRWPFKLWHSTPVLSSCTSVSVCVFFFFVAALRYSERGPGRYPLLRVLGAAHCCCLLFTPRVDRSQSPGGLIVLLSIKNHPTCLSAWRVCPEARVNKLPCS